MILLYFISYYNSYYKYAASSNDVTARHDAASTNDATGHAVPSATDVTARHVLEQHSGEQHDHHHATGSSTRQQRNGEDSQPLQQSNV